MASWASKPWHNIQESVINIQRHFIECLKTDTQPQTSGADNLKTLALVEAAYHSDLKKHVIYIDSILT